MVETSGGNKIVNNTQFREIGLLKIKVRTGQAKKIFTFYTKLQNNQYFFELSSFFQNSYNASIVQLNLGHFPKQGSATDCSTYL